MFGKLKSKIARWAVLRNKMEALKVLVNESDTYVIMSALRGPDTGNDDLKYIFTARIRHLAGMNCEGLGGSCRDVKEIRLKDVMEALKHIKEHDLHYLNHVYQALLELRYKGVIDDDEYVLLSELADILRKVANGYYSKDEAKQLILSLAENYKHLLEE